ncbi:MAG: hypothetical protein J5I50_04230 [Chitinophagaceae bacterium]|nr:hypothetical protein [Chitinophagaceae bacterium]
MQRSYARRYNPEGLKRQPGRHVRIAGWAATGLNDVVFAEGEFGVRCSWFLPSALIPGLIEVDIKPAEIPQSEALNND